MPVYWIWFAELKGISLMMKRRLLEACGDPEELYHGNAAVFSGQSPEVAEALEDKDLTKARQILQQCAKQGIGIITYGDADYPVRLRNIEDPPMVLYFKGRLPDWQAQPVIGVVGTRTASAYGLHTARLLAAQIAVCGGLVVSGAANGIDACSMEGALEEGKAAVAVLGGGVDVVYPAKNKDLYRRTEENGCLISQYPPGSRPYPGNFLQRNRIISGISDGVLVVEAPEKSGALNTANHALSQGRDLFAVPGNLGVNSCRGSNALLQEGAYAALSGWDVVKHYENLYPGVVEKRPVSVDTPQGEALPLVAQKPTIPQVSASQKEIPSKNSIDNLGKSTYSVINKRPVGLSDQETAVLELLGDAPQLTDSVMDASNLPSGTVQSILTRLTIKGLVQHHPDGRISRK